MESQHQGFTCCPRSPSRNVSNFALLWVPLKQNSVRLKKTQLDEDDSAWDFDGLLQAVTQEFNAQAMAESGSNESGAARDFPLPTGSRSALGLRASRALVA